MINIVLNVHILATKIEDLTHFLLKNTLICNFCDFEENCKNLNLKCIYKNKSLLKYF